MLIGLLYLNTILICTTPDTVKKLKKTTTTPIENNEHIYGENDPFLLLPEPIHRLLPNFCLTVSFPVISNKTITHHQYIQTACAYFKFVRIFLRHSNTAS